LQREAGSRAVSVELDVQLIKLGHAEKEKVFLGKVCRCIGWVATSAGMVRKEQGPEGWGRRRGKWGDKNEWWGLGIG
jgi:hypothetical protein